MAPAARRHRTPSLHILLLWDPCARGKGWERAVMDDPSAWNWCRTGARCRSLCAATGGLGVLGKSFLTQKENKTKKKPSQKAALGLFLPAVTPAGVGVGTGWGNPWCWVGRG